MSQQRGLRARRKGDGQGAWDNAAPRFLKEQATLCRTTYSATVAGVTRGKGAVTFVAFGLGRAGDFAPIVCG